MRAALKQSKPLRPAQIQEHECLHEPCSVAELDILPFWQESVVPHACIWLKQRRIPAVVLPAISGTAYLRTVLLYA